MAGEFRLSSEVVAGASADKMKPRFFSTPAQFRQWLEKNYDSATELLLAFHKKSSGKKSITYNEALDEALCFGWIDGVRKRLDETSYTIRFTPRKSWSIWSLVNVNHVRKMSALSSQRWLLTLNNNQEFIVSKRQASSVRQILSWYSKRQKWVPTSSCPNRSTQWRWTKK